MLIYLLRPSLVRVQGELRHFAGHCTLSLPHTLAVSALQHGAAIGADGLIQWRGFMGTAFAERALKRLVAPEVEPVSLAQAKSFLRIDDTQQDSLLSDMIVAARLAAEERTGRSLISQQWRLQYDDVAPALVRLPYGPVQSIEAVRLIDAMGDASVLDSSHYAINAMGQLQFNAQMHSTQIQIDYVAGFGDEPSDVPSDIVQAMLLHIANMYEHRDTMMPPALSLSHYHSYREIKL